MKTRRVIKCPHCNLKIVTNIPEETIKHEKPVCEDYKKAEKEFSKTS